MLDAPVIYIFFNRPDIVRRTFPSIRAQQPRRLYLMADGPRASRAGEAERCRETRAVVEQLIDWECEVTRDYSEVNLGCGRRLSSGLTAAFEKLGEAIVLEDDILPHPDFFGFCQRQLSLHRDNPRIHSVGGFNPLGRYRPREMAVVPTRHNSIWGWASWQRAWKDYRFDLGEWSDPALRERLRLELGDDLLFQHYAHGLDRTVRGELDTWDYQWTLAMLRERRHALATTSNFIENIGFVGDATHTHAPEPWLAGLRTYPAVPDAPTPACDAPDCTHDRLYNTVIMSGSALKIRLARAAGTRAWLRRRLAP